VRGLAEVDAPALIAHAVRAVMHAPRLEEAFKLEDALRKPLEKVMRKEGLTMVRPVTRLVERTPKRG
jgi:hypothetical protein